jgi:tRNA A-37 threonylcarbamoyl transferase component Bud32
MGLTPGDAIRFAGGHGLVDEHAATAAPLGGGVSNDTLLVADASRRIVVKRALGRLRTAVEWHASPSRALDEARSLQIAAQLTPANVPQVLAVDAATATIALAAAPDSWRDWRLELLDGTVRTAVGPRLGRGVGTWHAGTAAEPGLVADFDGMDRMEALRLTPFHSVIAARHPDLAGPILAVAEELRQQRVCLVHGDFSPKNILVGDEGLWVIDFEVAHVGNPVFDLAFLSAHLLLKAVAAPPRAGSLGAAAVGFLDAWRAAVDGSPLDADRWCARLGAHVGALVLARLDGTSLVDYLDPAGIETARDLGRGLVTGSVDLDDVWMAVSGG